MIPVLIVGYCYGLRSERRLTQEVELHLAYRWFCRLEQAKTLPNELFKSLTWDRGVFCSKKTEIVAYEPGTEHQTNRLNRRITVRRAGRTGCQSINRAAARLVAARGCGHRSTLLDASLAINETSALRKLLFDRLCRPQRQRRHRYCRIGGRPRGEDTRARGEQVLMVERTALGIDDTRLLILRHPQGAHNMS